MLAESAHHAIRLADVIFDKPRDRDKDCINICLAVASQRRRRDFGRCDGSSRCGGLGKAPVGKKGDPKWMCAFNTLPVSGGRLIDVLPDLGDHNGAFAHRGGHPLDRPGAYVADSKNAGVGCRERRSR
jgi:hypothetical protein